MLHCREPSNYWLQSWTDNGSSATAPQKQRTHNRFLALHRGGVDRFSASLVWGHAFAHGFTDHCRHV